LINEVSPLNYLELTGEVKYNQFKESFEHVTQDEGIRIESNAKIDRVVEKVMNYIK